MGQRLAGEEGIMAGISSGANMWAAAQVAARPNSKANGSSPSCAASANVTCPRRCSAA